MPHTLLTLVHGEDKTRLQYPTWRVAAPPREQHVERMTRAPVRGGSHVRPLGRDPVVLNIQLTHDTHRVSGHWQSELDALRSLQGEQLELFWGELEWRAPNGWYFRGLTIEYGDPPQYPPDIGGPFPSEGGMMFPLCQVTLVLTTDRMEVKWPTPPGLVGGIVSAVEGQ